MIHSHSKPNQEIVVEHVLMRNVQRWVAPQRAWLLAREGSLWVTRSGDPDDHFLARGERLSVSRGDDLVLQAWHRDQPAVWDWQPLAAPSRYRLRRELPAWAWARVARGLRGTADGLAALARSAAARACRAQGCISAGDSMASAGTLQ
jgi:Protein of unknown function (DUF2917)